MEMAIRKPRNAKVRPIKHVARVNVVEIGLRVQVKGTQMVIDEQQHLGIRVLRARMDAVLHQTRTVAHIRDQLARAIRQTKCNVGSLWWGRDQLGQLELQGSLTCIPLGLDASKLVGRWQVKQRSLNVHSYGFRYGLGNSPWCGLDGRQGALRIAIRMASQWNRKMAAFVVLFVQGKGRAYERLVGS